MAVVEQLMQPWADVPDAHDLLRVLLARPAWQQDAACLGRGPGAFFIDPGGDLEPARTVCRSCPVRIDCLEFALAHDHLHGLWAGTSPNQREQARRRGLDAAQLIAEFG